MSNEADRQAQNVTPPFASATPAEGTTAIATSTSSASIDFNDYPAFFGRYVALQADGGKIYVTFDDDSTHSINEATTGSTLANGTTEAIPWAIPDGTTLNVRLERTTHRYLHHKAASGTPTLRIRTTTPLGPRTRSR
jgi:DNA-binding beta-propeller fold protein YncE